MSIKKFYMVWNPKGRAPNKRHKNFQTAKDEAHRLAKHQPGDEFFVLACIGCAQIRPVNWETTQDPDD